MRKLFTIISLVLSVACAWAQSPQLMSYQAVIRDAGDKLVVSQSVGMRISIIQGSATGTEVYKETYNPNPQTNVNGLVSVEIGSGIPVAGTFADIDWANGPYYIKTETDPTGGVSYTITGTSQLLSVPYALFSANGTPGPQGPAGQDGAIGPQGPAGQDGATGPQGTTGPVGAIGPQGAAGMDGATGPQGIAGPAGAIGPQGAAGMDGATGPQGLTGPAGATGNTEGLIYPTGLSNLQGVISTSGTTYIVPANKVLYITNWSTSNSASMSINGILVCVGPSLSSNTLGMRMPFILSAGMAVNGGGIFWSGFLTDENPAITPIILGGGGYVVPAGKNLVVMNYFTQGSGSPITVNGYPFFYNSYSNFSPGNYNTALYSPVVLPAGTVLSFTNGGMSLQGYLR